jgi:leucyl aminopeptidase
VSLASRSDLTAAPRVAGATQTNARTCCVHRTAPPERVARHRRRRCRGDRAAARVRRERAAGAPGAEEVDAAFAGELAGLLALAGASGKAEEVVRLPTRGTLTAGLLVAVGLGKPEAGPEPSAEQVRRASGAAARALAGTGHAVSTLGAMDLAAAAEGTLMGAYAFREYRTNGEGKAPVGRVDLVVPDLDDAGERTLRTATAVGEAVRTARDLVNTPPNDLFPESFAARAAALAEAAGVQVEVLDDAALAEAGFGGVLGVGQGSARKPRLVRLSWSGGDSPRRRSRSWARASPSTPAASRSSRRRAWTT